MDLPETLNMDFIESQYVLWKDDPNAVSRDWQFFFEGFEIVNPFKVLAVLQAHIPAKLLEGHYAEQNPAMFGKREVILSMYLSGK